MSDTAAFAGPSKTRHYVTWALQILLALAFLAAGGFKLAGAHPMVQLFDQIGFGQWFRIVTGLVEIVGAVGLLVPGFAGPAALWLGFTMICAVLTHLAILHTQPRACRGAGRPRRRGGVPAPGADLRVAGSEPLRPRPTNRSSGNPPPITRDKRTS